MPSSAAALPIAPDDLAMLRRWAGATQALAAVAQRAKILLLAAEGWPTPRSPSGWRFPARR
jgi:hypothetical protein